MALINVADARELFGVVAEVSDNRIQTCINAASLQLKTWVAAAVYTDAESQTPTEPNRALALRNSEANLVMYHLLLNTGIKTRVYGVGTATESEMSADELKSLRRQFLNEAVMQAAPYRTNGANPLATTLPILREIKDVM